MKRYQRVSVPSLWLSDYRVNRLQEFRFPQESHGSRRKRLRLGSSVGREELFSRKEISHRAENLSNKLAGETGAQQTMVTATTLILVMPILHPYLNLNFMSELQKMNLEYWASLFLFLMWMYWINSPFPCFSLLLSFFLTGLLGMGDQI